MWKLTLGLSCFFCSILGKLNAQTITADSLKIHDSHKFNYKALIIPTALVGYGLVGLESESLKVFNGEIQSEVNEHIDEKISIDDFAQYTPMVAVYGLNAAGIAGQHNFKDRTVILGTAYLIMGGTVNVIKHVSNETRPDGSSNNSFPSGHTATAFMGATFLYEEYKDVSIWYGISGYVVAAGTGFFRIYNDRHWFNDVAAGAGIGILSTKIAYWLHPWMNRTFFNSSERTTAVIMPFYNGEQLGAGFSMQF